MPAGQWGHVALLVGRKRLDLTNNGLQRLVDNVNCPVHRGITVLTSQGLRPGYPKAPSRERERAVQR